ncbi:MAG: pseudouridine synthase [Calditrichia bacterium]
MKEQKIRLNRFLAMSGLGSRRKCDDLIVQGVIRVNGEVITKLGTQIDPRKDVVEYSGTRVRPDEKLIYILLNKPLRTVTTASDEKRRKTVLDIVKIEQRIFPVGRLDYNTTGALLLTNDGDLAYFLSHPRFEVSKVYRVLLDKRIRPIDLHHFRNGIELDDRKTAPCRAEEVRIIDNRSYLEIELHEGRNRQIRRMFEALDYRVDELQRAEFAGLRINDLKEGEWRLLTPREIQSLKKMVQERRHEVVGNADERE